MIKAARFQPVTRRSTLAALGRLVLVVEGQRRLVVVCWQSQRVTFDLKPLKPTPSSALLLLVSLRHLFCLLDSASSEGHLPLVP